jgi:hypothetical protein
VIDPAPRPLPVPDRRLRETTAERLAALDRYGAAVAARIDARAALESATERLRRSVRELGSDPLGELDRYPSRTGVANR